MANNAFDGCEKVEKALWFCDFFMFKKRLSAFTAVKRDTKF